MMTVLIILALLVLVAIPGLWVKRVLRKYSEPADRYADKGNGAQLARHLLDRFELNDVAVEVTPVGDHYDPQAKAVRLTEDNYHGHSLTAVTVGNAIRGNNTIVVNSSSSVSNGAKIRIVALMVKR